MDVRSQLSGDPDRQAPRPGLVALHLLADPLASLGESAVSPLVREALTTTARHLPSQDPTAVNPATPAALAPSGEGRPAGQLGRQRADRFINDPTRGFAFLALFALIACGGGGPTPPTPTAAAPTPLHVSTHDGWSGAPVSAAVSPAAPLPGAVVTAEAAGYLPRLQLAAPQIFLWPQDEEYVRALVYHRWSPGQLLSRWTRAFTVRSGAPLESGDAEFLAAAAVEATGLEVRVDAGGQVAVVVEPDNLAFERNPAAVAVTELGFSGSETTSCRLVFRRFVRRNWLLHELGHCLGLGHTLELGDVMQTGGGVAEAYSSRERVALRLMYAHRAPGNAPPDREAAAAAARQRASSSVVVD